MKRMGTPSDNMAGCKRIWIYLAASVVLAACSGPATGPEDALRLWVDDMELVAEDKDRSAMLDKISEAYADARGNNRKDVGDKLLIYFLRQQAVAFVSTINDITVSGDSAAKVTLTVAMAGTNDGTFGLSADAYNFELELEKVDSDWLLIGAKWGELGKNLR
jgi:hypothetical protein